MKAEVHELRDSARKVMNGTGLAASERETWPLVGELGWLMVNVAEAHGGLGLGLSAACTLQVEMGRGLATVPYLSALLSIEAVAESNVGRASGLLDELVAGTDYVAASLVADAAACKHSGDDLQLSGTLRAVPSADNASHALVSANDTLSLVPTAEARLTPTATWDTTRRLFDVALDAVHVPAARVLARGPEAARISARLGVLRDFSLASDAVGGAAALLALTVEYLQTRHQFGRPLALFQALKHRCADLKAHIEAADALLQANLGRLGGDKDAALGQAAKELACSVYADVAEESLQLHGGIGMTSEHVCHLFFKRAMLNEHLGGPTGSYADALASVLLASPA